MCERLDVSHGRVAAPFACVVFAAGAALGASSRIGPSASAAAEAQARRLEKGKLALERLEQDARRNKRRDAWELVIRELEGALALAPKGARAAEAAALAARAREDLWSASRSKIDASAAIDAHRRVDQGFPGTTEAAAALLRAVNLARRIGDSETAASAARRLAARYPGTPEASSVAELAGFGSGAHAPVGPSTQGRTPARQKATSAAASTEGRTPAREEATSAAARLLDGVVEAARKGAIRAASSGKDGDDDDEEEGLPPEPEAPDSVAPAVVKQALPPPADAEPEHPEKVEKARELRAAALASKGASLTEQLALRIKRVVVDAGHGGRDTGALGPRGTREKDVALAIARVLAAKLRSLGFDVVLTRNDDRYLTLDERTRIANDAHADLFLSIHCNAARRRKLSGVETWTLNVASDRYASRLAAFENSDAEKSTSDLRLILADLATRANTDDSRDIAQSVQSALVRTLRSRGEKVPDLGIKHALFFVLLGARMPAILVETGFISNPLEEMRLRTPERQRAAADAIARGVREFADARRRIARAP